MEHIISGKIGEGLAAKFLKQNGYEIVAYNYRNYIGEIDLIAQKDDILSFVEVKYRTNAKFGLPREAVGIKKQRTIRLVAEIYLQHCEENYREFSFDVLEVLNDEIKHIKNCF
ncbi:MAG: YraN family protein [Clostridia bacterium]